jgi:hypothetical protein
MRLTLTLILVASVVVLAQPPPTPRGPVPPLPPPTTYAWKPAADITVKELSQLVPLFAGPRGGITAQMPSGRLLWIMPQPETPRSPAAAAVATCPPDTALFTLTDQDTAKLGKLMRHFTRCTPAP